MILRTPHPRSTKCVFPRHSRHRKRGETRHSVPTLCGRGSRAPGPSKRGFGVISAGYGGEGGIRTHGTLAGTTVFETAPFDHSGTSPRSGQGEARKLVLRDGRRKVERAALQVAVRWRCRWPAICRLGRGLIMVQGCRARRSTLGKGRRSRARAGRSGCGRGVGRRLWSERWRGCAPTLCDAMRGKGELGPLLRAGGHAVSDKTVGTSRPTSWRAAGRCRCRSSGVHVGPRPKPAGAVRAGARGRSRPRHPVTQCRWTRRP
jgi:hypothetical protein